jgi:hypothetical protein
MHQRSSVMRVFLKEVGMALFFNNDVVHQNRQFVSETFIIKFVTFLNHFFKGLS